jgi:hypothetical protein
MMRFEICQARLEFVEYPALSLDSFVETAIESPQLAIEVLQAGIDDCEPRVDFRLEPPQVALVGFLQESAIDVSFQLLEGHTRREAHHSIVVLPKTMPAPIRHD